MATDYLAQARQQLAGSLANQKTQLQNNVNSQILDLNSSKGTINQNYDSQVQGAKDTGVQTVHAYNNNTLARGLGRSTIATTGIAGIQNTTAKNVTSLNAQRNLQLDNLEKLKAQIKQNLTSSLSGLDQEYSTNAMNLATQLRQRDEDVAYRNAQMAEQKRQFDAQMNWEKQKFAQQQAQAAAAARARSSSGGGSSSRAVRSTQKTSLLSQGQALKNEGYSADYLYDWIGGLNVSNSTKDTLKRQLGAAPVKIPDPVTGADERGPVAGSGSVSKYYGNGSTYRVYSGGR